MIFKLKNSKYPSKTTRKREPIADWYTLRIDKTNRRDVILDSFHTGSSKDDIVFKCMQYRKGKMINIGKLRIEDETRKAEAIKALLNGKKIVCEVIIDDMGSEKKSKNIRFVKRIKDKPFRSVVIDSERELSSVEVVNIHTKKVESFKI